VLCVSYAWCDSSTLGSRCEVMDGFGAFRWNRDKVATLRESFETNVGGAAVKNAPPAARQAAMARQRIRQSGGTSPNPAPPAAAADRPVTTLTVMRKTHWRCTRCRLACGGDPDPHCQAGLPGCECRVVTSCPRRSLTNDRQGYDDGRVTYEDLVRDGGADRMASLAGSATTVSVWTWSVRRPLG
jgi:hypothetical protein